MKINYTIKEYKDRKVVYNRGDFTIDLLRKELYNLYYGRQSSVYVKDPTRTVKIEDKL